MNAARALRYARRRAGLTQRQLAEKAGVPQSTIGRIEAGLVDPRATTLDALLRAAGYDLEIEPRLGIGIDRTQMEDSLQVPPQMRVARTSKEARLLGLLANARRRTPSPLTPSS